MILGCSPPEGHPAPVVRWIKDGQFLDLTSANKFQIVGSGNLVISGVQKADAGRYICSARNLAGTKESVQAEIKITGNFPECLQQFPGCNFQQLEPTEPFGWRLMGRRDGATLAAPSWRS
jgi:hypothetical protein